MVQVLRADEREQVRLHKIKPESKRGINLNHSLERRMKGFLIDKNISLNSWLKDRIGKRTTLQIANTIE